MIEIKMSGLCEGCDKADLTLDCMELENFYETKKEWTIKCIHNEACERMYAQTMREVTE